jgi:hypothetical protein
MANFPEIEPSTRSYDLGEFSGSVSSSFAGGGVRFSHGEDSYGQEMTLAFLDISESDAALIRDHYRIQGSSHLSFILFSITWRAHSDPEAIAPPGARWVYVGAPREIHRKGKLYGMEVVLRYVGADPTS